jgi:quinoprotein dehydrogenase-associated probable ABC transporter substrate-binding protein
MPALADRRSRKAALVAGLLALAAANGAVSPTAAQTVPDLVTRDAFRVCADPANMPFSNRQAEGFENKIADIVADELKVPVRYFWLSQGPGFARNTLQTGLCDVIIGYAAGADPVQHTNPYYSSVYVLVVKADGPLADVTRLDDPRLKGHRLGVIAATPPVDHLMEQGLIKDAKSYALLVERRFQSPGEDMIADLVSGEIDGGLLWGPIGGYFAKQAKAPLKVIPLVEDTGRPPLSFRITFGIRPEEDDWKHKLNGIIAKRQADFNRVLASYGVPLLDFNGKLIAVAAPAESGKAQ